MEFKENLVQSVDRAIDILEALAEEKSGMGVTSISKATGLHKSTVHRLLTTLMVRGYVEKDIDSDNYRLGNKILYLGSSILDRMDVRNVARPYIQRLSEKVNEVVHLSILDNDEVVYIDKVESPNATNSFRMNSQIGKRVPVHCTAAGKVLTSRLQENQVVAILRSNPMVKFTENTITTVEDFLEQLNKVREDGYAMDEIEHEEGIRCIAVPIFDHKGRIVASISISGLTIYVTKEKVPELKEELLNTAQQISYQLGYMGSTKNIIKN